MNLRDKQITCLQKMLSLAPSGSTILISIPCMFVLSPKSPWDYIGSTGSDFSDQWKVLIYDQDCRDIISPLLNVGALRQKGVTLHLLLHSDRESIPDAPAVYFIRPTEANLKRVVEDCSKQVSELDFSASFTYVINPTLSSIYL